MRYFFAIYFLICLVTNTSAQNTTDFGEMLRDSKSMLYSQPKESLKIAEHVLQYSENSNQRISAYLLFASAQYVMGEIDQTAKAIFEAKKLAEHTNDLEMQIITSVSSIHLLNHLGMKVVADKYYLKNGVLAAEISRENSDLYMKSGAALINAYQQLEQGKLPEALESFKKAYKLFENIPDRILTIETTAAIIENYLKATDVNLAENYFQSILADTLREHPNNFIKMSALNQLGKLYFLKKDYSESIASYQEALEIAEQLENKQYRAKIEEALSITYLALGDTPNFYSYKTSSSYLLNEVELDEDKAVNSIYNYISENNTLKRNVIENTYRQYLLISAGILLLIFLTWIVLKFRYRNRVKQYESFIKFFEEKKKPTKTTPLKEISKSLNIPLETKKILIQKLNQFENTKQFTKQDMSLAKLASHFETNTKYLSEIINTQKGKNFNSYINDLRINYIIDKLKSNNKYLQYKISYLAEESGFSSHSSFANIFKATTGISPKVFIDILSSKKKVSKTKYREYEEA